MKKSVSYRLLPFFPVLSGCIALILRLGLYTLQNESGLLPNNHPLYICTLILAVATALLVGCFVFRLDGSRVYQDNFPASRRAAIGSLVAGICLFFAAQSIRESALLPLESLWTVLAFSASLCLILAGFFLWKGVKVPFLLYGVVCLYFALHMVCCYRDWSGNPQTEDYIFAIFGCISLALFAYYRAAFSAGIGQRRMLLFSGMMVLFFCPPMLIHSGSREFYLAGILWAATNLCVIDPPKNIRGEE